MTTSLPKESLDIMLMFFSAMEQLIVEEDGKFTVDMTRDSDSLTALAELVGTDEIAAIKSIPLLVAGTSNWLLCLCAELDIDPREFLLNESSSYLRLG